MADGSSPAAITDRDLESLRGALDGDVLVSGDSAWDAGRQAWNLIAQQDPALIVHAESAQDVAATLTFGREHDLRVAPQSTGHGAAPLPDLGGAILLWTGRMASVSNAAAWSTKASRACASDRATSSRRLLPTPGAPLKSRTPRP